MEQNNNSSQALGSNQIQAVFAQPRITLSKDGEYLLHFLPGNVIVRKHINFYKKILGIPFIPKATSA